jgi:hypothetical protein
VSDRGLKAIVRSLSRVDSTGSFLEKGDATVTVPQSKAKLSGKMIFLWRQFLQRDPRWTHAWIL